MRISNPGGGLGKSGDQTLTAGNLTLDNNKFFKGQNTSGSGLALLGVDTDNALELGNSTTAIQFHSSATPTYTYGSATHKGVDASILYIKTQAADQEVDNSTTVVASDNLVLPLAASSTYFLILGIYLSAAGTPDNKMAITVPSGATAIGLGLIRTATQNPYYMQPDATTATSIFATGNLHDAVIIKTDTTAGNATIMFAQNTQTSGSPSTLKAGSSVIVVKVQ